MFVGSCEFSSGKSNVVSCLLGLMLRQLCCVCCELPLHVCVCDDVCVCVCECLSVCSCVVVCVCSVCVCAVLCVCACRVACLCLLVLLALIGGVRVCN
jgi:hypothetical protein